MKTNSQAPAASIPSQFADVDRESLWGALVSESGARVVVVDSDGEVVFANDRANKSCAPLIGRPSLEGSDLGAMEGLPVAQEWLGFVQRVVQNKRPLVVNGFMRGIKYRAFARPITSGGSTYALISACPAKDAPPPDQHVSAGVEVVDAKQKDMGNLSSLTDREMQVLEMIGQGLPTAEIARRLNRSVKTIEWHRASLGSKLGASNRVELARIAIGAGLSGLAEQPAGNGKRGR